LDSCLFVGRPHAHVLTPEPGQNLHQRRHCQIPPATSLSLLQAIDSPDYADHARQRTQAFPFKRPIAIAVYSDLDLIQVAAAMPCALRNSSAALARSVPHFEPIQDALHHLRVLL